MILRACILSLVLAQLVLPFTGSGDEDCPSWAATLELSREGLRPMEQIAPASHQKSVIKDKPAEKSLRNKAAKRDRGKKSPRLRSQRSKGATEPTLGRKKPRKNRPSSALAARPDLSYYGMLEHPRRYGSSLERLKGAVPNPRTSDLLHDHFQELDKNHDGMLDPLERARGRLDMDRDLGNRQRD